MTGAPETLKEQFWVAFGAAKTRTLKTKRAQWYWIDQSMLVDGLAGPLFKILNSGRCEYVYAPDDERFQGVVDPSTLHDWCRWYRDELSASLDRFAPTSPDEEADQASMHNFTADIWAMTERLLEVERAGWDAARSTRQA